MDRDGSDSNPFNRKKKDIVEKNFQETVFARRDRKRKIRREVVFVFET